jgi:hypothetical protein
MPRSRLVRSLLSLLLLAAATGCDYKTLRSTLEVAPAETIEVRVAGRQPMMRVTNDGPGELAVQFYADQFPVGDERRLRAGETTAEALGGDFHATLRGVAERTLATIRAERARGLTIQTANER